MWRVRTDITGGPGGAELATHYFDVVGGLTAADANAAVGAFWHTVRDLVHNAYTFSTESEVASVDIATGQVTGLTPVTAIVWAGTVSGQPLPPASQGLIRWRTGTFVGGREIRGRTFLPGPTEEHNLTGVPNSDYITVANNAAAALIAASGTELMTYSRKNSDAAPVVSGSCWNQWAVLRSRRQ